MIRSGVSMVSGSESRSYATPWSGPSTQIVRSMVAELNLVIVGAAMGVTALLAFDKDWMRKDAQLHRLPLTDYASPHGLPELASLIAARVKVANGRLPENQRVGTTRVISSALHFGNEELMPAQRLNRPVVASRYANLFSEPTGV